jgi:hypothetical protein
VGLKSLKSLNLTNGYPNKNKNENKNKNKKNNKVKSKPLELFELAGKNAELVSATVFGLLSLVRLSLTKKIMDKNNGQKNYRGKDKSSTPAV